MTPHERPLTRVDALETIRTYGARVRALPLHLYRLSRSLDALRVARGLATLDHRRHMMIHEEVKRAIKAHGLIGESLSSSPGVVGDDQAHTVIRCTVSLEGRVSVSFSALDVKYVGQPRSVALCALPLDPTLPRHAKHNARDAWVEESRRLRADELLFCGDAPRPEESPLFEAHNSNLWLMRCGPTEELALNGWLTRWASRHDTPWRRDPCIDHKPLSDTTWYTPPLDGQCLPGVTRALLINLLKSAGAHVCFDRSVSHIMTRRSAERHESQDIYYLSSTLKSVAPVSTINQVTQRRPLFDAELCMWLDNCLRSH